MVENNLFKIFVKSFVKSVSKKMCGVEQNLINLKGGFRFSSELYYFSFSNFLSSSQMSDSNVISDSMVHNDDSYFSDADRQFVSGSSSISPRLSNNEKEFILPVESRGLSNMPPGMASSPSSVDSSDDDCALYSSDSCEEISFTDGCEFVSSLEHYYVSSICSKCCEDHRPCIPCFQVKSKVLFMVFNKVDYNVLLLEDYVYMVVGQIVHKDVLCAVLIYSKDMLCSDSTRLCSNIYECQGLKDIQDSYLFVKDVVRTEWVVEHGFRPVEFSEINYPSVHKSLFLN